ncbi:unnamed protein product [Zymoseptoria tritici ST99CH_1A5]|uniref:2EXR domain-containing protein n=1 Tax=Zymoseptoria tritici ST99CH_1A5 TaxID=1276529 RepID=A0A1Y6LI13_ZYMTR|nr:unnamed protein product [Zymoseptoria tritici ST99CH_1A5]
MTMENSPLERLPQEIRDEIWEYALTQPKPIIITANTSTKALKKDWRSHAPKPVSLLHTCKKINNETRLLFYRLNVFTIQLDGTHSKNSSHRINEANITQLFFDAIGPQKTAAIGGFGVLVKHFHPIGAPRRRDTEIYEHVSGIVFPLRRLVRRLGPSCVVMCHFRWVAYARGGPREFEESGADWYVNLRDLYQTLDFPVEFGPYWKKFLQALKVGLVHEEMREVTDMVRGFRAD